jgi:hypothetical protein
MDEKLALVDIIEGVKEKLTSQKYKEILEALAKIKVTCKPKPKSEVQIGIEVVGESTNEVVRFDPHRINYVPIIPPVHLDMSDINWDVYRRPKDETSTGT